MVKQAAIIMQMSKDLFLFDMGISTTFSVEFYSLCDDKCVNVELSVIEQFVENAHFIYHNFNHGQHVFQMCARARGLGL